MLEAVDSEEDYVRYHSSASSGSSDYEKESVTSTSPLPSPPTIDLTTSPPLSSISPASSSEPINHNPHLTSSLERLSQLNATLGDTWRHRGYARVASIVRHFPRRISSKADLCEIRKTPGVGPKMQAKIEELLNTGQLGRLTHMNSDERILTMELFTQCHGVGPKTASHWYALGLRTLQDVVSSDKVRLNPKQELGLRFYEDLKQRIPRAEVKAIEEWIRAQGETLLQGIVVECCGSYRRGNVDSGDVDVLVTHPSFEAHGEGKKKLDEFTHLLQQRLHSPIRPPFTWRPVPIVDVEDEDAPLPSSSVAPAPLQPSPLSSHHPLSPFITGTLAHFDHRRSKHVQAISMSFCRLPEGHPLYSGFHRRLDLKVYPALMFPFALLYFTGGREFNMRMRGYAKRKGWSLSDHCIHRREEKREDRVVTDGGVECKTEEDIFAVLGLQFIPPTERNWNATSQFTPNDAAEGNS